MKTWNSLYQFYFLHKKYPPLYRTLFNLTDEEYCNLNDRVYHKCIDVMSPAKDARQERTTLLPPDMIQCVYMNERSCNIVSNKYNCVHCSSNAGERRNRFQESAPAWQRSTSTEEGCKGRGQTMVDVSNDGRPSDAPGSFPDPTVDLGHLLTQGT